MQKEQNLQASVELINDKVKFQGTAGTNEKITVDYIPPIGDGEGFMPLELFLLSFASCSGATIVSLLRRMGTTIAGLKVNAEGTRRDDHPKGFKTITLHFVITSNNAAEESIKKAIKLSEETYCPVWAMIRNNVEVAAEYTIINQ